MGKRNLLLAAMFFLSSAVFTQVNVTINLDMSQTDYNESFEDLYFSGGINEWVTPGADQQYEFIDNGDGTHKLLLTNVMPGYYYSDFYRVNQSGSGWPDAAHEWSGAPTGMDVLIYVAEEDVTIDVVWGEVHNVTLNVNMNNVDTFDVLTDQVFFLNNLIAYHKRVLTDIDGDGIYSVTFDGIEGRTDAGVPQGFLSTIFAYGSADNLVSEWSDAMPDIGKRMIKITDQDLDLTYNFGGMFAVGISEVNSPVFNIYPNPSNGIFSINQNCTYEIFNICGKSILKQQTSNNKNIDISSQAKGIYFIKMVSGSLTSVKKIIIR